MIPTNVPPNEVRFFVHGRIKRAIGGFIKGGLNPVSAATAFLAPAPRSRQVPSVFRIRPPGLRASNRSIVRNALAPVVRRPVSRALTARPGPASAAEKELGRERKFGGSRIGNTFFNPPKIFDRCFPPWFDDGSGGCTLDLIPGGGGGGTGADRDIGEPVMGQYGAAEMPGNMVVNRAICRPGMVLGDDGFCYNRSQISNKQRQWPRGRRPLLTGGDMRAISTAARAGKRLEGATKRLQKIGLMKKPAPRQKAFKLPAHQHQISSGG